MRRLIRECAGVLSLELTSREILDVLYRYRRSLSFKEITRKTRRSERAIRYHLKKLTHLGLVRKEIFITPHQRYAHRYRFPSREEFLRAIENEVHRRLTRLKELVR